MLVSENLWYNYTKYGSEKLKPHIFEQYKRKERKIMTYEIQRMYYENTNQTRVKLYQSQPLREFEVMLNGDLGKLADFQIEEMAKKELAKEFNPAPLIRELEQSQEDLKTGQDEIMVTLTELFEKVVANEGVEESLKGMENIEEPTESEGK